VAVAALTLAPGASAAPPDFSGKWKVVPSNAAAGVSMGSAPPALSGIGTMGSGWPDEVTLTQTAEALTVEYTYFHPREVQPPFRFVYTLDGAECRNTVDMGRGAQLQVSRAKWDGSRLVITTTHAFIKPSDGRPLTSEVRQTLSLDGDARTLTIETLRSAVLGGRSSTTTTVYRK
jgi:hypothetical protein